MHSLIGPFLTFNHAQPHQWCYLDLAPEGTTCFVWDSIHWSKHVFDAESTVLYAYVPSEHTRVAWVLTRGNPLFRIPLFELELEAGTPPVRRVSQVFQPFLMDTGIRWTLSHLKKASDLGVDATFFPPAVDAVRHAQLLSEMPKLPTNASPPLAPSQENATSSSSLVDVTTAWQQLGDQFIMTRSHLTTTQQLFIVNFIDVNGDWPLLNKPPVHEQIQRCLSLIKGTVTPSDNALAIRKYRDPMFLATLMTGSFYPTQADEPGWGTRVGDVWCFVNALLVSAVRLLGYTGYVTLARPPKKTGVCAGEYLSLHANTQIVTPSAIEFSVRDTDIYQLVMGYVEGEADASFDEYNENQMNEMSTVLKQILARQASILYLSDKLFVSITNLFQLDGESAYNYLTLSCDTLLRSLSQERFTRVKNDLVIQPTSNDCSIAIARFALLIRDLRDYVDCRGALDNLSMDHQEKLITCLGNDTRLIANPDSIDSVTTLLLMVPHQLHTQLITLFADDLRQLIDDRLQLERILDVLAPEAHQLYLSYFKPLLSCYKAARLTDRPDSKLNNDGRSSQVGLFSGNNLAGTVPGSADVATASMSSSVLSPSL